MLPSHRRRGIGHALVDAGEESLRAKGVRRVNVLVYEEDAGAGDLWTSRGYATNPRIARYWRDLCERRRPRLPGAGGGAGRAGTAVCRATW